MKWPQDATGWPMAEHSRMVECAPHRWHVQEFGNGPTALLLHGAGGATQSWRALAPKLAEQFHVICVDLPGQGFTQAGSKSRFGLKETAIDLNRLVKAEGWNPSLVIGHSAGAAVALQMSLQSTVPRIIGINAALGEFPGLSGVLFPAMAKLLSVLPFTAATFSTTATHSSVRKLLASTGSNIGKNGQDLYFRLIKDRTHVDATLSMMAQWDLKPLLRHLEKIDADVLLIAADQDQTVPPEVSVNAAKVLPNAKVQLIPGLGHLAHEEAAEEVADHIRRYWAEVTR